MDAGGGRAQRGAARPVAVVGVGLGLGTLLLALVMGGRADDGGTRGAPVAEVAPAADCLAPDVLAAFGLRLDAALATAGAHAAAPAVGRVPASFSAAGALVCRTGGTMRDGSGTWRAVTATTREGTAAQLATLLAALEGAPAPATPTVSPATCAADGSDRVELWLVDSMGRAVRPAMPADGCGRPTEAVQRALDALAVTDQSDAAVSLLAPAAQPGGTPPGQVPATAG